MNIPIGLQLFTVRDEMAKETHPDFVHVELDTYWVKAGGVDPADYLRKIKSRVPLIHIKDMDAEDK